MHGGLVQCHLLRRGLPHHRDTRDLWCLLPVTAYSHRRILRRWGVLRWRVLTVVLGLMLRLLLELYLWVDEDGSWSSEQMRVIALDPCLTSLPLVARGASRVPRPAEYGYADHSADGSPYDHLAVAVVFLVLVFLGVLVAGAIALADSHVKQGELVQVQVWCSIPRQSASATEEGEKSWGSGVGMYAISFHFVRGGESGEPPAVGQGCARKGTQTNAWIW